jgi:Bacterial Ig domain/Ig-like domain CHU_C associated
MKKTLLLAVLCSLLFFKTFGQSYSSTIVAGINEIAGTGTAVTLTASTSSSSLPIGFTFNFYGNAYTNFYINPNGTLSFGSANQNYLEAYYAPRNTIPSTNVPNNFIGFAFINPYDGAPSPNVYPNYSAATVNYFTSGTAPNRILVVNFKNVVIPATYSFADQFLNVQVQLFETDGKIEVHNTSNGATYSSEINRFKYIQIGIENIDGSNGTATTCPAEWNLGNQTVRFTYCPTTIAINVTANTSICNASSQQTVNLSATCSTGTATWYRETANYYNYFGTLTCSGVMSTIPLTSTSVQPTVTTVYKARCEGGACPSGFASTVITVTNSNPSPPDPIGKSPTTNPISAGTSVTLSTYCSSGYYKWADNSTTTTLSSRVVTPNQTTTYSVKCMNGACESASVSTTVNVIAPAVSVPEISSSINNACSGTNATLIATGCNSPDIVTWYLYGNTTSLGTGLTKVVNLTTTITWFINSYYATCTQNGVTSANSSYKNITVYGIPTAPSSIIKNPTTSVNPNTNVSLTANCASGNTIKWGDNSTTNPRIVAPAGTTTYTAQCMNTTCGSAETSVTVNVNCTVNAPNIHGYPQNIGVGETSTLQAYCSTIGETVKWEDNSTTNPRIVAPTAASTAYSAKCVSAVCESPSSNTYYVYVFTRPAAPTISTNISSVCLGSSVSLSATSCVSPNTITWYSGSDSYVGTNNPISVIPTANTTYYAKCGNTNISSLNSNAISIVITPLPVISNFLSSVINAATATVSLSASCPSGALSWYSKTGTVAEVLLGTTTPITVILDPLVLKYIVKCTDASTQCVNSLDFNSQNTLAGASVTTLNTTYNLGKFTASGTVFYDSGSSPFTINLTPDSPDPSTLYFTYGTFYGGFGGYGGTAQIIVRKNNNWEFWEYVNSNGNITKTRKYHSKEKYATLLPPCTAIFIKDVGSTEETLTIGSLCDNAGPVLPCPTITISVSPPLVLGTTSTLTVSGCNSPNYIIWSDGVAGTTASVTVTPTGASTYTATCWGSACSASVATNNSMALAANITVNGSISSNGSYNLGCYNFTAYYPSGSSQQSICPSSPDVGANYYTNGYTQSGQYTGPYIVQVVVRKNNIWEVQKLQPNLSQRLYHTKFQYNGTQPPCTAVWINDADGSEVTLTISGACQNETACSLPVNPSSASASPATINLGEASTLTASGCAVGNTYLWKNGTTTIATTPSFTTPVLTTTTIYTAYCLNGSCVSSGTDVTVTVNVTQGPFSISPTKYFAICQSTATITSSGCSGIVNWYRDVDGSGATNQFLASGNTLTYTTDANLRQYIRATCTVEGVISPLSNYCTVQTGPQIDPISYIVSPNTPITLTASSCPVGTTYLWATGETTQSVIKSLSIYTAYYVRCVNNTCQSADGDAYISVGNVIANNDAYNTTIDTPVLGNFCSNDGELSPKTIYVDYPPTHGSVVWDNTGAFTYTPSSNYVGTDSFIYYLNNGVGGYSNYATVTFNIVSCPTTLALSSTNTPSDDISTGTILKQVNSTSGTITATNKITGTAKVTYQAKSIQLNAGFKADNGTVFKAEVGGCM